MSVALPTPERLREQPLEAGGWSRFFDAVLAALELDDASATRLHARADDRRRTPRDAE